MHRSAKNIGLKRGALALVGLCAFAAPRLITAAPLDLMAEPSAPFYDPAEEAVANFPGSAFFFAEGAFDPVPGALTVQSEHVMGLADVTAAPATHFRGLTALDSYRALNCLVSAIYYEAGNEPEDGQRAVAQVVLNRVRHPLWPDSVCGVVYQGSERTDFRCQFTFSCDGSMTRTPVAGVWARARRVAQEALSGVVYKPVGLATFYHTLAVRPSWAASFQPVAVIGAHIFYRNMGADGTRQAFRISYSGRESISGRARTVWPQKPVAPLDLLSPAYTPSPSPLPPGPMRGSAVLPSGNPATPGWTPQPVSPSADGDNLPQSTIRPEYRNSGRPLI